MRTCLLTFLVLALVAAGSEAASRRYQTPAPVPTVALLEQICHHYGQQAALITQFCDRGGSDPAFIVWNRHLHTPTPIDVKIEQDEKFLFGGLSLPAA